MKRNLLRIAAIAGGASLALLGLFSPPAAAQEEGFEIHRAVPYVTRGEQELAADIYVPETEGPLPAVLMVHGGAWRAGSRSMMFAHAVRLVNRGYVVMSIDYRLAPEHPFPAQLEDCQAAIRWLRSHAEEYDIDPDSIAGYGYSAGGHLVCLLGMMDSPEELPTELPAEQEPATEDVTPEALAEVAPAEGQPATSEDTSEESAEVSTRLQAVVAGGAPCDFTYIPENSQVLAYWLGGSRSDLPDVYRLASPVLFATPGDPPVLFFHGEKDLLVWRASPLALQRRLLQLGIASQMHIVPTAGHMGAFFDDAAVEAAGDFLDEVLRGIPVESDDTATDDAATNDAAPDESTPNDAALDTTGEDTADSAAAE